MKHTKHIIGVKRVRRARSALGWIASRKAAHCAILVGALAVLLAATPAAAKLHIVATLSDLGSLAQQVGGDRVEVTYLCDGYRDPHHLEPKPSYARSVRGADLLVYDGLELEVGWLPPLLDTARNPDLRPGSQALLEASSAITKVLEVPTTPIDRSQGDLHPFGNPHYLLDPRNGVAVAEAIAERLAVLDPAGASYYEERAAAYRKHMDARIAEWEKEAASLKGVPVATYHKQWEYLADWLGLDVVGYIENRPGIPPSPRHVESLIKTLSSRQAKFIIVSTFADVKATEEVARRAGTTAVVLPAGVGGVDGTGTYEDLIDTIVKRLLGAAA
jgi:zinc/manganese transport system substrate-binding protein